MKKYSLSEPVLYEISEELKVYDELTQNLLLRRGIKDIDLAVVKGNFAVAENGAIWMKNESNRHRSLYFIAQNIVIVIDEKDIVNNMHEAYEKINFENSGYGVFISGPSKTADIEQSLVIGAHGPKSGYVIFIKS